MNRYYYKTCNEAIQMRRLRVMKHKRLQLTAFIMTFIVFVGLSASNYQRIRVQTEVPAMVSKNAVNITAAPGKSRPHHAPQIISDKYCKNANAPLNIKTYDRRDQANHPKVLYFDTGWNGWKYWMSYTPYPDGNAEYENPSIAVSNDGENWTQAAGNENPVVKRPPNANKGAHYSDPHLVMDGGTMELWYRYNPADPKNGGTSHIINIIYMKTSTDGVNWSDPKLILNDKGKYFSPAILLDNGVYKMWYSDDDGKLHLRQSADLADWSEPETVNIPTQGHCIWHQDVIRTKTGYDIVFSAFKKGEFSRNNQCLYYASSADGVNFSTPVLILSPSKEENRLDNQMIYRSSLVNVDGDYRIYYSAMSRSRQWHIFETNFHQNGS